MKLKIIWIYLKYILPLALVGMVIDLSLETDGYYIQLIFTFVGSLIATIRLKKKN